MFILVNLTIGLLIAGDVLESKHVKAFDKKDQEGKPLFNLTIAGVAVGLLISSLIINITIPAIDHHIVTRGGTEVDMVSPDFAPFNLWNGRYGKVPVTYIITSSISVSLFGVLYVWLIRCVLPEKLKPYITWRKLKDQ